VTSLCRDLPREVLLASRDPTEQEALLVGLLERLGLIDSRVTKDERRAAGRRAKTVAEQDASGPGGDRGRRSGRHA
jgi:hypothetical protein